MNFITYKNLIDKYNRDIDSAIQILAVIDEEGTLNIGELSGLMSMDTGNMSAQCKRLEQKGYTLRLRKKFDERVVDVSLTRNGRLVITELNDILNKRYKNKWNDLSDEEKESLINSYETMKKLFENK